MNKAVLFDVYGTLLSTTIFRSSLRHIVEELGLSDEQKHEAKKLVLTTNIPKISEVARILAERFGLNPVSDKAIELSDLEIDEHRESFAIFDGVNETIARLRVEGYKLALVTNVSSPYLEPIFRLEVDKFVDHPVYSCMVGCCKPDPEIFHIAMRELDVEPANTVMVGDNPFDDIVGAQAAGIRSIMIDPEGTAEIEYAAAAGLHQAGESPDGAKWVAVQSIREVPEAVTLLLDG